MTDMIVAEMPVEAVDPGELPDPPTVLSLNPRRS